MFSLPHYSTDHNHMWSCTIYDISVLLSVPAAISNNNQSVIWMKAANWKFRGLWIIAMLGHLLTLGESHNGNFHIHWIQHYALWDESSVHAIDTTVIKWVTQHPSIPQWFIQFRTNVVRLFQLKIKTLALREQLSCKYIKIPDELVFQVSSWDGPYSGSASTPQHQFNTCI